MAVAILVVQLDLRKTEHCKEHIPEIHAVGVHPQHEEKVVEVRVEDAENVGHQYDRQAVRDPESRGLLD